MTDETKTPPAEPRVLSSEDLLRGAREVAIQHGAETYRLRLTNNDKLILTK
ncbi:hemin uptake protein HemP [Roseomonas eburnea]|uniref:Hemin uptake protein HemP n=1 Tax=Neoroseomonas eburnea TaxID=1346889 RepID=A0A9X9XDV3_9PROT|nr:hemin uptake protein HemP [Neoroseomonas eburnea]MBR0681889.1 hemin uptake protein HemP [Neoroseomonas eburnea]